MIGNVYVLFDDKKRPGNYVKTFYKEDKKLFEELNEKGWGVYCSVNDFEATEDQMKLKGVKTKRNIPFLEKINAVFADLDIAKSGDNKTRVEKDELKEKLSLDLILKCEPSAIVDTSNGLQPIRILENSEITKEYQNRYVNVINGIIQWSKTVGASGDAVKDVTRILRVPGYFHMKEEPYKCTTKYGEGKKYKLEELEAIFKDYIPKPEIKKEYSKTDTTKQYQEIDRLDFEEVIIQAFQSVGRSCEFDRQKRLIIDGRLSGTFQGKHGDRRYLASTSHEPFEGNIVTSVADIQNTSTKEAYKRILEKFNIESETVLKKKVEKIEKKKEIIKETNENFTHISMKEKFEKVKQEMMNTDPNKIIKWGWEEWDNLLGGIYKGKIYTIGAGTGVGKTTFVNTIVKNVAIQGWKVVRYSLEDRLEDQGKEEIYDIVNRKRRKDGLRGYKRTNFVNNAYNDTVFWGYVDYAIKELCKLNITELDKKKTVKIENLIELMENACKKGTDMFVIDHLHYFEMDGSERHDLQIQNIMHQLNEIGRKNNVVIMLVAHYRNTTQGNPHPSRFKDGAAIKQVSNIIIQITRDEEDIIHEEYYVSDTIFHITKLRGRNVGNRKLRCSFDSETGEHNFKKTQAQKLKEMNI